MTWVRQLRVLLSASVILLIGATMLGISWTIGVRECIHLAKGEHPFVLSTFLFAFAGMTAGGLVIQTGSLVYAAQKFKKITKGMPGGRRWYDTKEQTTKEDE